MLTALTIRDVVLIDRLDLTFGPGLTVLTGETGAGKSILLDSLGLALGGRAEAGLVRTGAAQASVTASFVTPTGHPLTPLLTEQGIAAEDEVVFRRVLSKDGRSRAFINDQPVGVALMRHAASLLVEAHGQHEQIGLADPASHLVLLDSFGVPQPLRKGMAIAWHRWRDAIAALEAAQTAIATAKRDEEWLRHAVDELALLAPAAEEEERLARERQHLQQDRRRAEAVASALAELAPRDRRNPSPSAALGAARRCLGRLVSPSSSETEHPAGLALAAIERAEEALAEAESLLTRLAAEPEADPSRLERAEERLFALRAAARKHAVAVADLPGLLETLGARLAALDKGTLEVATLEQAVSRARQAFLDAGTALGAARRSAATRLDRAVARELPPLRLARARFRADVRACDEREWGPMGTEAVRFLIATNPGQDFGPLGRIASGGELSRLMLALKVVLSSASSVPTLVFDEVDAEIGGATAAAVGERLTRVAKRVQVLVVTHSPQVAARGSAHLLVSKQTARGRTATRVDPLDAPARREEIARMLAGEMITEAARAAADDLLRAAA
jgi:DNA repair protein RecN (Recombination protein N)